jgi:murein DD-endopeptidase MepM/ murein hydrolase activator NlpD
MQAVTFLRPLSWAVLLCLAMAQAFGQASPVTKVSAANSAAESTGKVVPRNPEWSIITQPERLVNGSPLLIEVSPPVALKSLTAEWLGHTLIFSAGPTGRWLAFAGVSLETKAGKVPLELHGTTADGALLSFRREFEIGEENYPTVELKVETKYTAPSPEQQEIIKRDQEIKKKTFEQVSGEREWAGSFKPPVDAPTSDIFGTRRVFNGVTKSVHQGLDFRVPAGTPVAAVNAGTVILAQPLYFEGNCVMIDHGQGLLTLYLHFSELKVKAGDVVKTGQVIGLSGATGRATGPHLHLAVRWQGTYLDPAVLLKLPIPTS